MRNKVRSIQRMMLTHFVILSAFILLLSAGVFSWMQYQVLQKDAEKNLQYTAETVASSIDLQVSEMSTISLNAIRALNYENMFSRYESGDTTAAEHNALRLQLANVLTTAKGFDFSVRQLNVYGTNGSGYGIGSYNGVLQANAMDQEWYDNTVQKGGTLFIEDPAADTFLSDSANVPEDTLYCGVVRRFYNSMRQPIGFVEVKKYYKTVFSSAMNLKSNANPHVYIYDEDGRQIFPHSSYEVTAQQPDPDYFTYKDLGSTDIHNPITKSKEYVTFAGTDKSGLIIAVTVSHKEFLAPVYQSMITILVLFLFLFLVSVFFAEYLSGKLSRPIVEIYHFLNHNDDDGFDEIQMPDTGIREIDKLKRSLNEDIQAKKAATDTMMVLKEKEMQAQMLALQSQMNPHFLYNSLSTIAEMAEEGQNDNVAQMCSDITEILRYISSNKDEVISVQEELEMCDLYLECMKFRYHDELTYSIQVPDEMLDGTIPKLCLQLLVENSLKYTTKQSPPWNICIEGHIDDKHWYLTVLDNGPGFDPEVDKHLRRQMDEILAKRILPSLQIHGMGILNVFIRLYLRDGIPFIFDFGNRPEGGAFVTVGGKFV